MLIKYLAMAALTMTAFIAVLMMSTSPDCNTPETWASESGVRHCATNGGK